LLFFRTFSLWRQLRTYQIMRRPAMAFILLPADTLCRNLSSSDVATFVRRNSLCSSNRAKVLRKYHTNLEDNGLQKLSRLQNRRPDNDRARILLIHYCCYRYYMVRGRWNFNRDEKRSPPLDTFLSRLYFTSHLHCHLKIHLNIFLRYRHSKKSFQWISSPIFSTHSLTPPSQSHFQIIAISFIILS